MQVFVMVPPDGEWHGGGDTVVHSVYATKALAEKVIEELVIKSADALEFETPEDRETYIEERQWDFNIDEFAVHTE